MCGKATAEGSVQKDTLTGAPLSRKSSPPRTFALLISFLVPEVIRLPFPSVGIFSFGVVRWQQYYLPDVGTVFPYKSLRGPLLPVVTALFALCLEWGTGKEVEGVGGCSLDTLAGAGNLWTNQLPV